MLKHIKNLIAIFIALLAVEIMFVMTLFPALVIYILTTLLFSLLFIVVYFLIRSWLG